MSHFKKSTSRDFRIDGTTVSAILHGQEVGNMQILCQPVITYYNTQDDGDSVNSSSTGSSPKAKKVKLSFASTSTTD